MHTPLIAASLAFSIWTPTQGAHDPGLQSRASLCLDLDGDGSGDLVTLTRGGAPQVLLGDGRGGYRDASAALGLEGLGGFQGLAAADADSDGLLDLFLPAFGRPSLLLVQSAQGTFTPAPPSWGLGQHADVLGAAFADLDGDRLPDLRLSTPTGEWVYLNQGGGSFTLGGTTSGATGLGGAGSLAMPSPLCAGSIDDQANPGSCLLASSVAQLGMLYPLSGDLFVDSASGFVGVGTTSPTARLDVAGEVRSASGGSMGVSR